MANHCLICGQEVEANNHFWRTHKIKEADYYQQYVPRYSKLTGELINFRNRDFYLSADFQDKNEMAEWFRDNPTEAKEYAVQLLTNRKEKKGLLYAPSQVELRSILAPSMIWFKKNFPNYKELCESVGLKCRFDKEDKPIKYGEIPDDSKIIIDTREQKPLKFTHPHEIGTLKYGDYALRPNRFKLHIERKNLSDFAGTFGVGFERFCREVDRAKKDRAYLIVLVESSLNNALRFNFLPQMKYCKVSPDFVFHHVREIMQKYNNIQFLFCEGRVEAAALTKKIFSMKSHPKHWDLQYLYETKQL